MQKLDESFDGTFTDNIRSNAYKAQFANRRNTVVINVSGIVFSITETQYAVVKHVAKKNKWNMIVDPVSALNFDICWVDGIARQDLFTRMTPYQKINHFPGIFLSIKAWEFCQEKTTSGKTLCCLEEDFPTNISSSPSLGIYLKTSTILRLIINADSKERHRHSS